MQEQQHKDNNVYTDDVERLMIGEREIILVGTAHVSRESVELVKKVIEAEKPDCVCVELDDKRFNALSGQKRWESLDLREIIRKKQLSTLLVNLVLASYQKKLGMQLGVMPGAELLEAAREAEKHAIPVTLCDRDVRVTLRRAWHETSFLKKGYLLATLLASLFDKTEITEEKLQELKKKDVLSELMSELGEAMPELKKVLIDERDIYLAEKIKNSPGRRLVAVVGAGHMAGIVRNIREDNSSAMAAISSFPPVSSAFKALGWSIPLLIIGSLVAIGILKGSGAAGANLLYWILANGIPTAIGAMLAWGHPYTIATAFVAAPLTSLTPVIGAGYVTAFVQVLVRPPLVREFETVGEDMATVAGWWKNKLLRVFLAFLLPGLGSMIGTWVGGVEIISNLF
ncbi:MAG: TraB/GumN family protein [Deltaproteobacteria bacterium]|jgi:pheromone shutdown-related protein TraB|nr:TraB/GumN family protein [Deltaproteobacteria bacterium]